MVEDARFEDGRERPLNLGAEDAEDLQVISSLCQDAVFPITEMKFAKGQFALLVNRFRWEDEDRAQRSPERVQSVLLFEDVQGVSSQGIDRGDKQMVLSLLSVTFEAGDDGTGDVILTLAGDGAIRLRVEALGVTLKDVTRPYLAPSKSVPNHS
jgi:hypothetical protein